MPIDNLTAVLKVVLDAVEQAVFIDNSKIRIIGIVGGFADVVFFDDVVDGEVVQACACGKFFAEGCFADTGRAGDDDVGAISKHDAAKEGPVAGERWSEGAYEIRGNGHGSCRILPE